MLAKEYADGLQVKDVSTNLYIFILGLRGF